MESLESDRTLGELIAGCATQSGWLEHVPKWGEGKWRAPTRFFRSPAKRGSAACPGLLPRLQRHHVHGERCVDGRQPFKAEHG